MRRHLASAFSSFCLITVTAMAGSGLEGESQLVRPDPAPDPDAKGEIEVEIEGEIEGNEQSLEQELEIEAKNLDLGATYEVFMEDELGAMVSIGFLAADEDDELSLEFESEVETEVEEGESESESEGTLPLGAQSLEELIGRRVEIRSGGELYLYGTVPSASEQDKKASQWRQAKSSLTRPDGFEDDDAHGAVDVRTRDADGRHRLKVKADDMPDGDYRFFLEDAVGSDTMVEVAALLVDADDDDDEDDFEYEFKADTQHGDPLPLGAASIDELSGRRVEVRDSLSAVVLVGMVPSLPESKADTKSSKAEDKLFSESLAVKASIKIKSAPKKGSEELKLKVKKLFGAASVDLYMQSPSSGLMEEVAVLVVDSDGSAKLKVSTKKGQSLPFGAFSVSELSGLAIEVRDSGSGDVLLSGVMPSF